MTKKLILTFCLTLAVFVVFSVSMLLAQDTKKVKILCYSRSSAWQHEPTELLPDGKTTIFGNALRAYFSDKKIPVELVETHDGRVFDDNLNQYDAFIFYACGNLLADKKDEPETSHAMSQKGLKQFFDAVRSGKGLVGIHSATDTFCDLKDENGEDLYTKLIGARFVSHGPMQFGTLTVTEPVELPWLKETGKKITNFEEWYAMKEFNKDIHVLLVQQLTALEGDCYKRSPYPSSWIRMEGKGRVAYSAYGHAIPFWKHPENVRKIGELVEWSLGHFDLDTTPNIEKVTPKYGDVK
ncbi:MAG: ThuA domain-containing protein [Planctomycetaceae bacterium]|jgi:type 1 glutamine amidotransferase|nr:ThuA domain-containing protein [Planctomycetaceae bacterium]